MSFAITDLLLNTGVFKIPAIVRLYQIQTPLRPGLRHVWLHDRRRAVRQGYDGRLCRPHDGFSGLRDRRGFLRL